jgi:hypothetical protein
LLSEALQTLQLRTFQTKDGKFENCQYVNVALEILVGSEKVVNILGAEYTRVIDIEHKIKGFEGFKVRDENIWCVSFWFEICFRLSLKNTIVLNDWLCL